MGPDSEGYAAVAADHSYDGISHKAKAKESQSRRAECYISLRVRIRIGEGATSLQHLQVRTKQYLHYL